MENTDGDTHLSQGRKCVQRCEPAEMYGGIDMRSVDVGGNLRDGIIADSDHEEIRRRKLVGEAQWNGVQ
jgi:hypothetical protein